MRADPSDLTRPLLRVATDFCSFIKTASSVLSYLSCLVHLPFLALASMNVREYVSRPCRIGALSFACEGRQFKRGRGAASRATNPFRSPTKSKHCTAHVLGGHGKKHLAFSKLLLLSLGSLLRSKSKARSDDGPYLPKREKQPHRARQRERETKKQSRLASPRSRLFNPSSLRILACNANGSSLAQSVPPITSAILRGIGGKNHVSSTF